MKEVKKILVIRLSSFGDIVLTFPFLNELRRLYPEAQIEFMCKKEYAKLVRLSPHVKYAIEFDKWIKFFLKYQKFDLTFDLQMNPKSLYYAPINSKIYRVVKETWKKLLLVHFKKNLLTEPIPVYKKYLNTLKKFDSRTVTDFTVSELRVMPYMDFEGKYIVLSPSSKHFTKRLPEDKFLQLLNGLKTKIVLTGARIEPDMGICAYLHSKLENSVNLCGKLTIPELAGVLNYAELVVCNDSGIMHLSEALGKKVFVFFGSTVKEFGFFPQLETSVVAEVQGLKCRPCTHIGRKTCPEKHFKCMNDIDLEPVRLKINEIVP